MKKHRGKTLDEWKEYIKKDGPTGGIRTQKYIIVLEDMLKESEYHMNEIREMLKETWEDDTPDIKYLGEQLSIYFTYMNPDGTIVE